MATIELTTYHAEPAPGAIAGVRIRFNIGAPPPFPSRRVEVKNTAAAIVARDAYEADVKAATGDLLAVSMRLVDGRSPPGFKDASSGYRTVNYPETVE